MDAVSKAAKLETLRRRRAEVEQRQQQIRARFPDLHDANMIAIAIHDPYWAGDGWIAEAERLTTTDI